MEISETVSRLLLSALGIGSTAQVLLNTLNNKFLNKVLINLLGIGFHEL